MTTQNFLQNLVSNHPHLSNTKLAALASVPVSEVRALRGNGPKRVLLAPVYGASVFGDAPESTTAFEQDLRMARKFRTVEDAADSILALHTLLAQARQAGDVAAEGAVIQTALNLHLRARHNKPEQAEAFALFVQKAMQEGLQAAQD